MADDELRKGIRGERSSTLGSGSRLNGEGKEEKIGATRRIRETHWVRPEYFQLSSKRAEQLFDYLVKSFTEDYMRKRYVLEVSGWRSLVEAARAMDLPPRTMYGGTGGFSAFVNELIQKGIVEVRVFPGERGRKGETSKFRIFYDRKPVQSYVDRLIVGKEEQGEPGTADKSRIAVLPFANMSPDPKEEYFADGMTEELISAISRISGLRVVARTSVMGFKGSLRNIKEIAEELSVGTVLEGSVRKEGHRLRISVQLIDSQTSAHLWADNYDRELRDVFVIQSEIARRVAEKLKVKLHASEESGFERRPTQSTEAYEHYLQGRSHFNKFTKEGLERSLEFYQQALEADPGFALSYEGMAATHQWFGFLNLLPEKVAYPKARELAERALELDESLAGCHYILGRTLVEYYWALKTGESELRRSIELAPNNATVHLAYAWLLASRLDSQPAAAEAERAVRLDPKSAEAWWSGSYTFYLLGQFDKGIEYGLKSIELSPLDPNSHMLTSFSYLFSGRTEDAIREMREAAALGNNHVYYKSNLGFVYGLAERKEEAMKILNELIEATKTEHVAPLLIAWAYAGVGDADSFFAWLQKAYEEHSSYLVYTRNDPFTFKTGFRSDPRFNALMEKIGL